MSLLVPLLTVFLTAGPKPSAADLRRDAEGAERVGDWEAAFTAYSHLFVTDRTARQKLNATLRRVQQQRRHRDPAFRQFVQGMSVADALTLFAEVVDKVPGRFADRDRATPQALWEAAVEEFDRALGSAGWRAAFLGECPADKVEAFRTTLRTAWAKRPIVTPRDARTTLRQLIAASQDSFPLRVPAAVAVEFLCGACSGLDEYTEFQNPASEAGEAPAGSASVFGAEMRLRNVGYVRVAAFRPGTPRELDAAIAELKGRGMRSLVLDLRGNHGGSFTAAVEVAKRFLPGGVVVTTQGQLSEVAGRVFTSDSGTGAHDVPLVVLIDAETASAAEVVAAALKDHRRAELVGLPTFGKGTMQSPVKLSSIDGVDDMGRAVPRSGSVSLTVARLQSPRGVPLNGVGVEPNVVEADPVLQMELALQRAVAKLPAPRVAPIEP